MFSHFENFHLKLYAKYGNRSTAALAASDGAFSLWGPPSDVPLMFHDFVSRAGQIHLYLVA